jgi:hypothetical protein
MVPVRNHFIVFFTKYPEGILPQNDETDGLLLPRLFEAKLNDKHFGTCARNFAADLEVLEALARFAMRVDRLDANRLGGDAGGGLATLPLFEYLAKSIASDRLRREEAFVTTAAAA